RLPDGDAAVLEDRHFAARRMLQDAGARIRLAQWDTDLLEGDAHLLQSQPGPERPGRVILVGDDEGEVGHALFLLPDGSHAKVAAPSQAPPASPCCRHWIRRSTS